MRRLQFSLKNLLLFTAACCILSSLAASVGAQALGMIVVVGGSILTGLFAWIWAATRAPQAIKYGSLSVAIVLGGWTLLSSWLLRSRDVARHNQTSVILRRIGHEISD